MGSEGDNNVHYTFKVRNDDGSEGIKAEIIKECKCSHPDAREYGGCNVVESGRMVSTVEKIRY